MSIRILSEEVQRKAEEELNESPGRIQPDLDHIRDWIAKQPHLNARTDDQTLVNFLRTAKFSLERAKEKIEIFYTARTTIPELFHGRDPFAPEIQQLLDLRRYSFITDPSKPTQAPVLFFRCLTSNFEGISLMDVFKLQIMILDILINEDDGIIVNGVHLITDLKELHTRYVLELTLPTLKKYSTALQDGYPLRLKSITYINVPAAIEPIYQLLRPFLKEKIRQRVHMWGKNFHGQLHEMLPASLLPKDYNGTAGSLDDIADETRKKVEEYREWFVHDAQFRTDESKRLGVSKMAMDFFGVDGSFRKLLID